MNGQKFRELVHQRQTEEHLRELLSIIEARGISVDIEVKPTGWTKEHRFLWENTVTLKWRSTEEEWWLREAALKHEGYVVD